MAGRTLYTARIKFNNFTPPVVTKHGSSLQKPKKLVWKSFYTFVQWASVSSSDCTGQPSINGVARIYCQFVFNSGVNKRNSINNKWVGHFSTSTSKIGFPSPMRVFYCFASRASRVCSNFDQKRELNVLISGRGRKWDGRTKVWWESLTSTQPTLASHSGLTLANTQPTLASHPPIVGGFCFTLPALGPSHRQESGRGMHRYLPGDMATMHKLFNA